jgi:FtsP/CotA-like multicopper oxidase with cupredoxin domain
MAETEEQILPGRPTRMWTYDGIFPGPTIRRPSGQPTRVTFRNELPPDAGETTVHHHGSHVPAESDGHPHDFLIAPGQRRTYTYPGTEDGGPERGAPQWYHDHRHMVTGRNNWMGLMGMFILEDEAERSLGLPRGDFDIPLMVTDRRFDEDNQLTYDFEFFGTTGDTVLVNGAVQPYLSVADRRYRFRILNASNARPYTFSLGNGASMVQVGTESGLLPEAVPRTEIRLGPAERADVVIDFAGRQGERVRLRHQADGGQADDLLEFRVDHHRRETSRLPTALRPLPDLPEPTVTRTWDFGRDGDLWTINGLAFDPARTDARPRLGVTERWVFTNSSSVDHMVHVHEVDQQLLSRDGRAPAAYERIKETWFLEPGERVEVKLRFGDHTGRYIIHCHVLEHEDTGMMSQFEVVR